MQFARKVQEPGRSRNLSCLMLRRAKATEDRWRHCYQPLLPFRLFPSHLLPLLVSSPLGSPKPRTDPCDHPFPQPMRDDRGGHLGWRVIERKRWVRNLLWGCVLSAPLGVGRERERDRAGGRVDDENWKLKKGGCEGLLALYWSIALPCFALLSYYNVESPLVVPRYPLRGRVRLII